MPSRSGRVRSRETHARRAYCEIHVYSYTCTRYFADQLLQLDDATVGTLSLGKQQSYIFQIPIPHCCTPVTHRLTAAAASPLPSSLRFCSVPVSTVADHFHTCNPSSSYISPQSSTNKAPSRSASTPHINLVSHSPNAHRYHFCARLSSHTVHLHVETSPPLLSKYSGKHDQL